MSTGPYRAVLFDKDGTLIDHDASWFDVTLALALESADGDRDHADRLMIAGGHAPGTRHFMADSVIAAGTIAELVDLWLPDLGATARADRIGHFERTFAQAMADTAVAVPGLAETLDRIAAMGLAMGVATNDSAAGARATLGSLGVSDRFQVLLGYDSVARAKPHADQLFAFAAAVGVEPAQIVMVGDNSHDLEMARRGGAGLAVGVLTGTGNHASLAPLADHVLASITGLPDLLR